MTVLRVCYKHGVRFDEAYYISKHLPLGGGVFGPHVKNIEVMKVTTTADGSTPPYQLVYSAYFESPVALQAVMQDPRMNEVLGDIKNFYDGMPDVLIGEVVPLTATAH